MFAQGALDLDTSEPVLAVPQRAVHEDGRRCLRLHTARRQDRSTSVKVGAGYPGATFVEVREGLAAGDRVIVTEITAAQVGQKVFVRPESAPAASALTATR